MILFLIKNFAIIHFIINHAVVLFKIDYFAINIYRNHSSKWLKQFSSFHSLLIKQLR